MPIYYFRCGKELIYSTSDLPQNCAETLLNLLKKKFPERAINLLAAGSLDDEDRILFSVDWENAEREVTRHFIIAQVSWEPWFPRWKRLRDYYDAAKSFHKRRLSEQARQDDSMPKSGAASLSAGDEERPKALLDLAYRCSALIADDPTRWAECVTWFRSIEVDDASQWQNLYQPNCRRIIVGWKTTFERFRQVDSNWRIGEIVIYDDEALFFLDREQAKRIVLLTALALDADFDVQGVGLDMPWNERQWVWASLRQLCDERSVELIDFALRKLARDEPAKVDAFQPTYQQVEHIIARTDALRDPILEYLSFDHSPQLFRQQRRRALEQILSAVDSLEPLLPGSHNIRRWSNPGNVYSAIKALREFCADIKRCRENDTNANSVIFRSRHANEPQDTLWKIGTALNILRATLNGEEPPTEWPAQHVEPKPDCKSFAPKLELNAAETESGECSHSDDFNSVTWFGTKYSFRKGQQISAVEMLWKAWESKNPSLSQSTIGERIGSASDRFRLDHVFRMDGKPHAAWDSMIKRVNKGVYSLVPPQITNHQ